MVQIVDIEGGPGDGEQDEDASPIEEVQMTVPTGDDTALPVWTFRMWALRLVSCVLMSFLNQFFSYRIEPIVVTQITVQVASLPLGHFLARVLPARKFKAPALLGGGGGEFSPSGGSSSPAPWPSCHAVHQHHHGDDEPGAWAQRHIRVHHRAYPPRQAHRQRRLQGVRGM
jgi:hypothetical protein